MKLTFSEMPLKSAGLVHLVCGLMNRVRYTLDRVSPFSDEVIEKPEAVENYTHRLRREPPGGRVSNNASNSPLALSPRTVSGFSRAVQRTDGPPA